MNGNGIPWILRVILYAVCTGILKFLLKYWPDDGLFRLKLVANNWNNKIKIVVSEYIFYFICCLVWFRTWIMKIITLWFCIIVTAASETKGWYFTRGGRRCVRRNLVITRIMFNINGDWLTQDFSLING